MLMEGQEITQQKLPARYFGKHPGGRPTDYRPEYCQDIIEFFDKDHFEESDVVFKTKSFTKTEKKRVPARLPTIEGFANYLGINKSQLYDWAQVHPEFNIALTRAKQLQQDILVHGGLEGVYDSRFATFVAQNYTQLRVQPIELRATVEHEVNPEDRALLESIRDSLTGSINPMIDITPGK